MKSLTDKEIISVITAAVAAMKYRPGYLMRVKSFRRVSGTAPVWNATGRVELVSNKVHY